MIGHKKVLQSKETKFLQQKIQLRSPYVTPLNIMQVNPTAQPKPGMNVAIMSDGSQNGLGGRSQRPLDSPPCSYFCTDIGNNAGIRPMKRLAAEISMCHAICPAHGLAHQTAQPTGSGGAAEEAV